MGTGAAGGALFTVPTTATGAAGAISLATSDPAAIAAAGAGEGSSGNTNANALAALATASLTNGQSASTYFAGVLSGLGRRGVECHDGAGSAGGGAHTIDDAEECTFGGVA